MYTPNSRGGSRAGGLGGAQQRTGGGVVADIFRGLSQASRLGGGGGVVAKIFRDLSQASRLWAGGGGWVVVAEIFRDLHQSPTRFGREGALYHTFSNVYHTFAGLARYSRVDQPIYKKHEQKTTQTKIKEEKNIHSITKKNFFFLQTV